ncbi:MAG: MogA/MoaB family molybdenum cofactor biosynthesis protein [Candidatus Dormibacter sp.]
MADVARCVVITVSTSRAAGSGAGDASGDLVASRVESLPGRIVHRALVRDDIDAIRAAVGAVHADLVVLTGGTGIAPSDVTPEAVLPLLQRELPGMAEAMRAAGLAKTPHAMLSRQVAGVMGTTLLLALPGRTAACADCLDAVWPALPHALALLREGT